MYVGRSGVVLLVILLSSTLMPILASGQVQKTAERIAAEKAFNEGIALGDGSEKEEQCYLRACALDPSFAKPVFNLGVIYSERSSYNLAATQFKRFLRFEPNSTSALYQLALCYDALGDKRAFECYSRFIKLVGASQEEIPYVDAATERLADMNSPKDVILAQSDFTKDEIVKILSKPRMKSLWRYTGGGGLYSNCKIQFKQGSAELDMTSENTAALEMLADALKTGTLDKFRFRINGHASSEGSDSVNQPLSEERARTLKKYLLSKGLSEDQLATQGFGASLPAASPENTEQDRQINRRVEIENIGTRDGSLTSEEKPVRIPQ